MALRHHLNLPGAGTGLIRFYDEVSPSGPSSPKPANLVPPPGPPMVPGAPLPVGPVDDDVSHRMRALELLSSYMDVPEVEALLARFLPKPSPAESVHTSHRELAQDLADKCKRQEKCRRCLLNRGIIKFVEEERAPRVGPVGWRSFGFG